HGRPEARREGRGDPPCRQSGSAGDHRMKRKTKKKAVATKAAKRRKSRVALRPSIRSRAGSAKVSGAGSESVFIGLMSGTSLDGVSAAAVRFSSRDNRLHAELIGFVNT